VSTAPDVMTVAQAAEYLQVGVKVVRRLCQVDCDFSVADLARNDIVEIGNVASTPKGLRGSDVTFVERPKGLPFTGPVDGQHYKRGFCFVVANGIRVMCHELDFLDYEYGKSDGFDRIREGTVLTGEIMEHPLGHRGIRIARVCQSD
jgi:hypothetical protein